MERGIMAVVDIIKAIATDRNSNPYNKINTNLTLYR
jgi:hypothetical protein